MRIIGGKYKGRRFNHKVPSSARPTTDSLRETIFNILGNYLDFEGIRAADLCAGTGLLGLEALSRGCDFCCFVENNKKAIEFIESAISLLNIPKDNYFIAVADVLSIIKKIPVFLPKIKFDLIFFDPPYSSELYNPVIALLSTGEILNKGAIFVVEHSSSHRLLIPSNWEKLSERIFGETAVDFFEFKMNS